MATIEYEGVSRQYELAFNGRLIRCGDMVKFKRDYGLYRFRCIVHDIASDITKIECFDCATGAFRSFSVSRLQGPVVKRSFRRKLVSGNNNR